MKGGKIIILTLDLTNVQISCSVVHVFWCASHFNFIESSITKCPICHNNHMEPLPVSIRPELQITPLSK
jgi:hypothetical protein